MYHPTFGREWKSVVIPGIAYCYKHNDIDEVPDWGRTHSAKDGSIGQGEKSHQCDAAK